MSRLAVRIAASVTNRSAYSAQTIPAIDRVEQFRGVVARAVDRGAEAGECEPRHVLVECSKRRIKNEERDEHDHDRRHLVAQQGAQPGP